MVTTRRIDSLPLGPVRAIVAIEKMSMRNLERKAMCLTIHTPADNILSRSLFVALMSSLDCRIGEIQQSDSWDRPVHLKLAHIRLALEPEKDVKIKNITAEVKIIYKI